MDSISDSDSEDAGSIPAGVTQVFIYALHNFINDEIMLAFRKMSRDGLLNITLVRIDTQKHLNPGRFYLQKLIFHT